MLSLALLLALSPAEAGRRDLEQQIEVLQEQVRVLEQRVSQLEGGGSRQKADLEAEQAAGELISGAYDAFEAGDYERVRELLDTLTAEYPTTRANTAAERLRSEIAVIGAPLEIQVVRWLRGEATVDPEHLTVVAFWETWCPHCRREMPELSKRVAALADRGVDAIGLTRMSRDVTEEQVLAFLDESGVSFPIALEDGSVATQAGVSGIPAIAVLKGGVVVWRGHPARLDEATLERLLAD